MPLPSPPVKAKPLSHSGLATELPWVLEPLDSRGSAVELPWILDKDISSAGQGGRLPEEHRMRAD